MPLGMEVGLGQGHIVLDEDPAPLQRGTAPPLFSQCLLWSDGWMDQDATWYGGRPQPRQHCVTWGPGLPPPKGAQQPPSFQPMSTVAKRSPIAATAEHLFVLSATFSKAL